MGIGSMLAPGTARTRAPNSSSAIVSTSHINLYQVLSGEFAKLLLFSFGILQNISDTLLLYSYLILTIFIPQ